MPFGAAPALAPRCVFHSLLRAMCCLFRPLFSIVCQGVATLAMNDLLFKGIWGAFYSAAFSEFLVVSSITHLQAQVSRFSRPSTNKKASNRNKHSSLGRIFSVFSASSPPCRETTAGDVLIFQVSCNTTASTSFSPHNVLYKPQHFLLY